MSNTYLLERNGWDVLCIEPAPSIQAALRKTRKNVLAIACGKSNEDAQPFVEVALDMTWQPMINEQKFNTSALSGLVEKTDEQQEQWAHQVEQHQALNPRKSYSVVDVRTLDWCLEQQGWEQVDFVSIDTEGTDMNVLEGFSIDKYKPTVILMENWWEDARYKDYLKPYGFELVQRIARQNELYVNKERVLHEMQG
ncbi:MAG: FkbM family methyltransferase, partial [bacterium]